MSDTKKLEAIVLACLKTIDGLDPQDTGIVLSQVVAAWLCVESDDEARRLLSSFCVSALRSRPAYRKLMDEWRPDA